MIIDSHCHAWEHWPYTPQVPDPESRGRIEQALFEMDANDVDGVVVVCASTGGNTDNNAYVADCAREYRGRIYQFADLDCSWSDTYHTLGATDRLKRLADAYPLHGITHYLKESGDGSWLQSDESFALFGEIERRSLAVSISCRPHQQASLRLLAHRVPGVPFICHHLGLPGPGAKATDPEFSEVLASARIPNIYIKISGFAYSARERWEYPYKNVQNLVRALYDHYGSRRLCWGSDYPAGREHMTYKQALESFATHCDFASPQDREWILGRTALSVVET